MRIGKVIIEIIMGNCEKSAYLDRKRAAKLQNDQEVAKDIPAYRKSEEFIA